MYYVRTVNTNTMKTILFLFSIFSASFATSAMEVAQENFIGPCGGEPEVSPDSAQEVEDLLTQITSSIDFSGLSPDIYKATSEELEKGRAAILRRSQQVGEDLLSQITSTIDFSVLPDDTYRATPEELQKGQAIILRIKNGSEVSEEALPPTDAVSDSSKQVYQSQLL